jgi:hypothetical protein
MINENFPDFPQPYPKNDRQHHEIPKIAVTLIFPVSPNAMNLFVSYLLFVYSVIVLLYDFTGTEGNHRRL